MGNFAYLAVLGLCFLGTVWLEFAFRTRVYRRGLRLLITIVPVAAVFIAWDAYAVSEDHWTFDPDQITGLMAPAGLPIDELLFFLVIPCCAILTLEAVRSARGWTVGDEVNHQADGEAAQ